MGTKPVEVKLGQRYIRNIIKLLINFLKIWDSHKSDNKLKCRINVPAVADKIQRDGFSCELSTDAGNYLCNYI